MKEIDVSRDATLARLRDTLDGGTERSANEALLRWAWLFQRVEQGEIVPGIDWTNILEVAHAIRDHHLADPWGKAEAIAEFGDNPADGYAILVDIMSRAVDFAPERPLVHISQIMKAAAANASTESRSPHVQLLEALTCLLEAVAKAQIIHVAQLMDHPQATRREIAAVLGIHPNNLQRWLNQRLAHD